MEKNKKPKGKCEVGLYIKLQGDCVVKESAYKKLPVTILCGDNLEGMVKYRLGRCSIVRQLDLFSLSALERIAIIIGGRYTGSEITEFFRKVGFPSIKHDGTTKWRFVYAALQELQKQPYGSVNVAKIIEKLSDPQEYFGQFDYYKKIVEQLNEVLAFYGLEVSSKTGRYNQKVWK